MIVGGIIRGNARMINITSPKIKLDPRIGCGILKRIALLHNWEYHYAATTKKKSTNLIFIDRY